MPGPGGAFPCSGAFPRTNGLETRPVGANPDAARMGRLAGGSWNARLPGARSIQERMKWMATISAASAHR